MEYFNIYHDEIGTRVWCAIAVSLSFFCHSPAPSLPLHLLSVRAIPFVAKIDALCDALACCSAYSDPCVKHSGIVENLCANVFAANMFVYPTDYGNYKMVNLLKLREVLPLRLHIAARTIDSHLCRMHYSLYSHLFALLFFFSIEKATLAFLYVSFQYEKSLRKSDYIENIKKKHVISRCNKIERDNFINFCSSSTYEVLRSLEAPRRMSNQRTLDNIVFARYAIYVHTYITYFILYLNGRIGLNIEFLSRVSILRVSRHVLRI